MFGSTLNTGLQAQGGRPRRILIALICITLVSLLFLLYSYHPDPDPTHPVPSTNTTMMPMRGHDRELIVDQPSCKIPRTEIWPKYFKGNGPGAWHVNRVPNCSYEKLLVSLEEDDGRPEILRLLPTEDTDDPPEDCCVSEITRKDPGSDQGYKLSSCVPLRPSTPMMNVHGKEMLLIRCGDRLNFDATIPMDTPAVKEKVKYWKQQQLGSTTDKEKERHPISVLLLGLDSVSRSHAYRSLPLTLDYMTSQMDFIDFQGYHSAYFNTMSNFMAFLMDTTVYGARDICGANAYDPETIWDPCPFIWKKFDEAGYVTMYIEDGYKTIVSFREPPTDYYPYPLFRAASHLRRQGRQRQVSSHLPSWGDYCMSNESVPQFMLSYTRKFVDKFNPKTSRTKSSPPPPPFWAFTYLADPFHDELYALPTMDQEFLQFMQHLNSEHLRPLLESTLIIFLGDHGDRNNFFRSDSMEAYIERSMPPFLVRVPEQFRVRFPDFAEALNWNAANARLVTPFDLHHTMLHLLHLDNPKKGSEFVPVLENRSSLFHRVEGNRTCNQLNLPRCVCNMTLNPEHFTDPSALRQMIQFVEKRLNQFVLESGYQDICAKWTTAGLDDSLLSARILQKELHKTDQWSPLGTPWLTLVVLLKFKANPLEGVFEAKVRVQLDVLGDWLEGGAEILGDFTRISIYGKQSDCFQVKTGRDKKMKELCVCKNYGHVPKFR